MAVIRLVDDEKEKYIKNLLVSTEILLKSIKNDETIKKSEWDKTVYSEIERILEKKIFPLFQFLRRTINDQYYKDNFGIYRELVLSNGGLPEFFSYRQLLEDKNLADQKIKQILESEKVKSTEDFSQKWIDRANRMEENIEEKREYLLNTLPDKFQAIEFYEKIKDIEFPDIRNPNIYIKPIYSDKEDRERYIISWFNYIIGFGVWTIYVAQLEERSPRKSLLSSIFNTEDVTDNGFFSRKDNMINIDQEFKKFLEDHMSSGAFFLAREMDKMWKTIYPERISSFQLGPMFLKGISSGSLDFSWLFKEYPDSYFLIAIKEDLENNGINKNTKDSLIKTKYIWSTDKLIENRFGVCSRDLEKSLKEYIKFQDMRFYVS